MLTELIHQSVTWTTSGQCSDWICYFPCVPGWHSRRLPATAKYHDYQLLLHSDGIVTLANNNIIKHLKSNSRNKQFTRLRVRQTRRRPTSREKVLRLCCVLRELFNASLPINLHVFPFGKYSIFNSQWQSSQSPELRQTQIVTHCNWPGKYVVSLRPSTNNWSIRYSYFDKLHHCMWLISGWKENALSYLSANHFYFSLSVPLLA